MAVLVALLPVLLDALLHAPQGLLNAFALFEATSHARDSVWIGKGGSWPIEALTGALLLAMTQHITEPEISELSKLSRIQSQALC